MLNSAAFRIAFTLSLSVHLFAISAGGFFRGKPPIETNHKIEVTYLVPEEPRDKMEERIIENLPENYELRKKEMQKKDRKEKSVEEEGLTKAELPAKKEEYLDENELKKLEEYIQYYELIREKIKKHAAKNFSSREEGEVEVVFTLNKNGALKALSVNGPGSAKNSRLKNTALESIKYAAPFPAFPDSLTRGELAFTIAIIFKAK